MTESTTRFFKYNPKTTHVDDSVCFWCGDGFVEGDLVISTGKSGQKRYYHNKCFQREKAFNEVM